MEQILKSQVLKFNVDAQTNRTSNEVLFEHRTSRRDFGIFSTSAAADGGSDLIHLDMLKLEI